MRNLKFVLVILGEKDNTNIYKLLFSKIYLDYLYSCIQEITAEITFRYELELWVNSTAMLTSSERCKFYKD